MYEGHVQVKIILQAMGKCADGHFKFVFFKIVAIALFQATRLTDCLRLEGSIRTVGPFHTFNIFPKGCQNSRKVQPKFSCKLTVTLQSTTR